MSSRMSALLALVVCVVFAGLNFSRMPRQFMGALPYLTCDEASVVRAADSIVQDGYAGFRCHEVSIVSCYGGTQAFLDALTVWLMPEKFMKAGRLAKQPGKRWQWLAGNSREVGLLRFSRALYAVLALAFFFWAGRGLQLPVRLLLAAALGSSWSFVEAWLGVKDDYPSLLFLLLFVFFLKNFSQLPAEKRTLPAFFPVFLLGNLGIWVRIPMVVPVCLAAVLFLSGHFQEGRSLKLLIRDAAALLISTFGIYLLLHPNIFSSSMEMHWMDPTIFIGRAPHITFRDLALELRLVAFSCWPLLFMVPQLAEMARKRVHAFPERYLFYLFFSALALEALMWQKLQGRSYYYLSGTGLSFFQLQCLWQRGTGPSKKALALFSLMALATTLFAHFLLHGIHARGFHMDTGPSDTLAEERRLAAFLNDPAQAGKKIAVDALLRSVVFEESDATREVVYFDSLSEAPGELGRRLGAAAKVVATCWSAESSVLASEFHSPAGEKWKVFLRGKCEQYQPLVDRAAKPFMGYFKTAKFVVLDSGDLLADKGAQILDRAELSPRMLYGALYGDDSFGALLRLEGEKSLTGNFVSGIKAQSLVLSFDTACKEEGRVSLRLDIDGKIYGTSESSDVSEEFCRDYPKRVCESSWFRRWSQRRYSRALRLSGIGIRPRSKVKVVLDRLDPSGKGCPILLQMMHFR